MRLTPEERRAALLRVRQQLRQSNSMSLSMLAGGITQILADEASRPGLHLKTAMPYASLATVDFSQTAAALQEHDHLDGWLSQLIDDEAPLIERLPVMQALQNAANDVGVAFGEDMEAAGMGMLESYTNVRPGPVDTASYVRDVVNAWRERQTKNP